MEKNEELIQLGSGHFWSRRKLDKILAEETPSQLRIRAETIKKALKDDKPLAGESVGETLERRRPLKRLLERIVGVILEKEGKMKTSQIENIQQWAKTEVPTHFIGTRAIRYATGAQVDGLRSGLYRLDHVRWLPVTDKEITIQTRSGRTLKFNLLEKISPTDWQVILNSSLIPKIYNIERGVVGLKNGKTPTSYWGHSVKYEEQQKIKAVIFPTYLAIMSV